MNQSFLNNLHHNLYQGDPLNYQINICKDCTAKKKEYIKDTTKNKNKIPKDILNLGNIDVYCGGRSVKITTPTMLCLFGFDKKTHQLCLQFSDVKTNSEMRSFYDFMQDLELQQIKYIGLNEDTCHCYNSQIRQDKDEKYDPYLLVKVPFKDNRYNIEVCDKDLSQISVTNLYRFTKVKCDIYIDKIWKYNETYICKWKVNKVLLV